MHESDVRDLEVTVECAEGVSCSFAQFLVSLGTSALVHLGEVQDPTRGQVKTDLKLARHSINLLEMLKRKTSGNLDEDETRLLDALLDELNAKYDEQRKAAR